MEFILPALSAVCAIGALAVGVLIYISVSGFKRDARGRLEGLEHSLAQSNARSPADEPLVQAVSELARIGQRNHETLLSVLRDDRAYLEPRLQHIYAYLEQMHAGISHIYQFTQDDKNAERAEQTLELLRAMLNLLTIMHERLNALGGASDGEGDDLSAQLDALGADLCGAYGRLHALTEAQGAALERIGALMETHGTAHDAPIPALSPPEPVVDTPSCEHLFADLAARMDGITARLDALHGGLEARAPDAEAVSDSHRASEPFADMLPYLNSVNRALEALAEGVDDVRARLNAAPDGHHDDVEATLLALRDELEQRDAQLIERMEALRGAPQATEGASALGAFTEEIDRYNDVLTASRRKLKRITRAIDEAGRRTRSIQRKLRGDTPAGGKNASARDEFAED